MSFPQIFILNIKINPLTKTEVLAQIKNLLLSDEKGKQLVTTNPEFIMVAQHDVEFKNIINNSWLSVADGYGIRLAGQYQQAISNFQFPISKIKKLYIGLQIAWWGIMRNNKKLTAVPETITGTDLVPEICQLLSVIPAQAEIQSINKKIFLLGGYSDVPRLAAEKLKTMSAVETQNFASLQIDYASFEADNIIEKINQFQPAVLFVALNHPRAQKWINENLSQMPSVKLALGVGGAFDYIAGKIKRAPKKFQSSFEWLFRLFLQPQRWKRIYTAVVKFPWTVFKTNLSAKDKLAS